MGIYKNSEQIVKGVNKFLSIYFRNNVRHFYPKKYPEFIFFVDDRNILLVYDKKKQTMFIDVSLSYDYANKFNMNPNNFYEIQLDWVKKNFIEPIRNVDTIGAQQYMEWRKESEGE